MPFYNCNMCGTIFLYANQNMTGHLAHIQTQNCQGVLEPALHAEQLLLETIKERLDLALDALSKNYETAKQDFEIIQHIDADKRREIENVLGKIYNLIIFATQVALSLIPFVGPNLGSAAAAVLKGLGSGEPAAVLTGAAGIALNVQIQVPALQDSRDTPETYMERLFEHLEHAENALFEARFALPSISMTPVPSQGSVGGPQAIHPPSPSTDLNVSSLISSVAAFLIKIETLNESFGNGALFIPLIFAYGLTPRLDVSERPYFQQAELSAEFKTIASPGKNRTLEFNFPATSSPPEIFNGERCYTPEQLLKIRLYKTGFVKYTGQQTGLFKGSTGLPSMGRSVSLHHTTDAPGTALRELLLRIQNSLTQHAAPLGGQAHELEGHGRLTDLLSSLKIERYTKTRHFKQWFFGRYNPINKLIALAKPDGIVSWYEQRRRETILAWLIIYKMFELHLGTPLPALAPVNSKTNFKMQCAFCDIIDLAGRIPYFKKPPAGGGADRNILIESLFALPGIFEYYIGSDRQTMDQRMNIQDPNFGRVPALGRPQFKPSDIIAQASRPDTKSKKAGIFTTANYFPFYDALLCQATHSNYGTEHTNEDLYRQSAVKQVIDRINTIMHEYAAPTPIGDLEGETRRDILPQIRSITVEPRKLLEQYAHNNKTSDLLALLDQILRALGK